MNTDEHKNMAFFTPQQSQSGLRPVPRIAAMTVCIGSVIRLYTAQMKAMWMITSQHRPFWNDHMRDMVQTGVT